MAPLRPCAPAGVVVERQCVIRALQSRAEITGHEECQSEGVPVPQESFRITIATALRASTSISFAASVNDGIPKEIASFLYVWTKPASRRHKPWIDNGCPPE